MRHQRIIVKALVEQRVRHHQDAVIEDRMPAERDLPLGFRRGQANAGLEPLAVGVDQADQRNGYAEQAPRQPGQAVEAFFRRGIEDIQRAQRMQPKLFVGRDRGRCHRRSATGKR